MTTKNRWLSVLVVAVIVAAVSLISAGRGQAVAFSPTLGHRAPLFTLKSLAGQSVSLSQFAGKLVFVNFFASWCPPCQAETPDLVKMYKQYGSRVQFIGVDLTSSDTEADVRKFVARYGITYPVLLDQEGAVAQSYQVLGIPTSLFIDRSGVIVAKAEGGMSSALMQKDFSQLVNRPVA
ncbi:MAG: TlpA disulfide reductase family protein [Firmicutes bacterium]|nr:TlpA disulfide reductase family protein [Bacillota bacterium]